MTKLILWDWDNTLIDTTAAVLKSQNEVFAKYDLPQLDKPATNKSMRNFLLDLLHDPQKSEQARLYYLECYARNATELTLFPNAESILQLAKDKNFINVLASNKTGFLLRDEVKKTKLDTYFDRIIGAMDAPNDKPSKQFTDAAIQGFEPTRILSIGDSRADIQMAHNYENGLAVLIGDPHTPEFADLKPDAWYKNLEDAKQFLQK